MSRRMEFIVSGLALVFCLTVVMFTHTPLKQTGAAAQPAVTGTSVERSVSMPPPPTGSTFLPVKEEQPLRLQIGDLRMASYNGGVAVSNLRVTSNYLLHIWADLACGIPQRIKVEALAIKDEVDYGWGVHEAYIPSSTDEYRAQPLRIWCLPESSTQLGDVWLDAEEARRLERSGR